MASIWVHFRGEKNPQKAVGHMSKSEAIKNFHTSIHKYAIKNGWQWKRVFDHEVVFFKHGQLVASAFIEFYSPPSAQEPGQPKRTTAV